MNYNDNAQVNAVRTRKPTFLNNDSDKGKNSRPAAQRFADNRQEKVERVKPTEVVIDINDDFKGITTMGWKIWINPKKRVVCSPDSENDLRRRFRTFAYEPGKLHIVDDSVNDSCIVFYRSNKFQAFMDLYKVSKVINLGPNGEYRVVDNCDNGIYHKSFILCDGTVTAKSDPDKSGNVPVLINSRYANAFLRVEGASIVIFDRLTYKDNGAPIVYRTIITDLQILEVEDAIADMIKAIDEKHS